MIKAYDAKDGMSKAINNHLDAIITDVVMPELAFQYLGLLFIYIILEQF